MSYRHHVDDSPDSAAGPSGPSFGWLGPSAELREEQSITPPCLAGHHAVVPGSSYQGGLPSSFELPEESGAEESGSANPGELPEEFGGAVHLSGADHSSSLRDHVGQDAAPGAHPEELQPRISTRLLWSTHEAEAKTMTATMNLARAATRYDSPVELRGTEESFDPFDEVYSSLLSVAYTHQASLLFQGTPSRSSSFRQTPFTPTDPLGTISVSFDPPASSIVRRCCAFVTRSRRSPAWNSVHNALLTSNLQKRSRHFGLWRKRFAVLTPHNVWTLEKYNSACATDFIELAQITRVTLCSDVLILQCATHKVTLKFESLGEALHWMRTLVPKAQEARRTHLYESFSG